ncbi:MAG: hypothetical protein B7Z80_10825 [Rhodospirillales bacterium 20-64-7]|nr:MAG: hypothetical protein B7Z80_10825 [Rhodospirillales bacterium 20-64-7]HQT76314.1 hypothetical protein [Rhodopila sp.]
MNSSILDHIRALRRQRRSYMLAALTCLGLGLSLAFAPTLRAQTVLHAPSGDDLTMIAYAIAGAEPPYAEWANGLRSVTALDEFKRAAAAKVAEQRLRTRAETVRSTRIIEVNFFAQFGEYNDIYHEFDLSIDDGTVVNFQSDIHPAGISVHFNNGGLAQSWPVAHEDAAKILNLVGGDRSVSVSAKIELGGASIPASGDAPIEVAGKILEYDVVSPQKRLRLGHVVVH